MLDSRVYTCLRVRPPMGAAVDTMRMEVSSDCTTLTTIKDANMLSSMSRTSTETRYTVDHVFDTSTTNHDVFSHIWPRMRTRMLNGENANFCVYGQTGSGKTHTVDGIIADILADLFSSIEAVSTSLEVTVSYAQIYLDSVYDLLNKNKLVVFSKAKFSDIDDLSSVSVTTPDAVMALLDQAQCYKKKSEHALNKLSSRSHTILKMVARFTKDGEPREYAPALYLVDLAGSERNARTLTRGTLFEEGCHINKSLSCLAKCLESMSQRQSLIPFRESVLTMFLRDSLCSDGFILICCIAPEQANESETRSTINFAMIARRAVSHRQCLAEQSKRRSLREHHEAILESSLADQRVQYEEELRFLKTRLANTQAASAKYQELSNTMRTRLGMMKQQKERLDDSVALLQHKLAKKPDDRRTWERLNAFVTESAERVQEVFAEKFAIFGEAAAGVKNVDHYENIESKGFAMDDVTVAESMQRIYIKEFELTDRSALLQRFLIKQPSRTVEPKPSAVAKPKSRSSSVLGRLFTQRAEKEAALRQERERKCAECTQVESDDRKRIEAQWVEEQSALCFEFALSVHQCRVGEHTSALKECNHALQVERDALSLEARRLQKKADKTEKKVSRIAMEKARNQCFAREALSRADIAASESLQRRKLCDAARQFIQNALEQHKLFAVEARRRYKLETHTNKSLQKAMQKVSHQVTQSSLRERDQFANQNAELRTAFFEMKKRFTDSLQDIKKLMLATENQTQVISQKKKETEAIAAQHSLQLQESETRSYTVMRSLCDQRTYTFMELMLLHSKIALSLEAERNLSLMTASFWHKGTLDLHTKSREYIEIIERLHNEIEDNTEVYAQKALECDDWQSAALLWKTRCDSIAKVLHGKSIIDLPEVMNEDGDLLIESGFEILLNALIRIQPPAVQRRPTLDLPTRVATPQRQVLGRASYAPESKAAPQQRSEAGRKTFSGIPALDIHVPSSAETRKTSYGTCPKPTQKKSVDNGRKTYSAGTKALTPVAPAAKVRTPTRAASPAWSERQRAPATPYQATHVSTPSPTVSASRSASFVPRSAALTPHKSSPSPQLHATGGFQRGQLRPQAHEPPGLNLSSPMIQTKRASPYRIPKLQLNALHTPTHATVRNKSTPCKCSVCTGEAA